MKKREKKLLSSILALSLTIGMIPVGGTMGKTSINADETNAVESDLPVQKVEGLSKDFFMGADVSSAQALLDGGVTYYDKDGNEKGLYDIMADSGINYVRLRLWNDPYLSTATTESSKTVANSYGAGVCDINYVIKMALDAKKAGLKVFLDFHYSDFWADPGKQKLPKAWSSYSGQTLNDAVYDFTYDSLNTLKEAGVNNIGMVQVGNETTNGVSGTKYGTTAYYNVFKYGCQAVRDFSYENNLDIKNVIHFTDQTSFNYGTVATNFINAGVDFDIFGSSYYPEWSAHGTIDSICLNLNRVNSVKNTKTGEYIKPMIAEVGYRYQGSTNDDNGVYAKYSISKEGQAVFLRDLIKGVSDIGGVGVFYWEPAWVACGLDYNTYGTGWASDNASEYDSGASNGGGECATTNLALFAKKANRQIQATEVLDVFKYVYTGTTAAPQPVEMGDNLVSNPSFEIDYDNGAYDNLRTITNWNLVSSVGTETDMPIYTENNNGYDGNAKLSVWTDSYNSYTVEAYQEIDISKTGAGKYYISLCECGNISGIYAYIKDSSYASDGTVNKVNLSAVDSYNKFEDYIDVTNTNTITVGIKAENVSKSAWANIDSIEVRYCGESEGGTDNPENPDNPDDPINPDNPDEILGTLEKTSVLVTSADDNSENAYVVNWTKVENATSYDVCIGGKVIATVDGDSTSFVVTNAFAGRNRINVVAHADKYEDSTSASAYVYVPDEIISANAKYTSDNEILLSIDFTIGGEADGFVIYQSTNGSEFTKIGDTKGLINSYTVKGVSKSNKYDFKIIPYCENEFILYGKAYKLTVNSQTSDNKDSDSSDLTEEIPQKGQQIKDKKYIYKVTKAGNKNALGELSVTGLKKTSLKVVKIAAKVTIGGISYKVTSVDKKAFKNNKKITKVFIGKNVQSIGVNAFRGCKKLSAVSINSTVLKTIGKNAFYNCKKLKKVIIKSSKLTKIGKAAFKEIKKKAVFKVPKSKKNKYKKMIEKAGAKNPKVK